MTPEEKSALRARALQWYVDAADHRKATCGPLIEMVDILRQVVQLHDEQALTRDGALDGLRLPATMNW